MCKTEVQMLCAYGMSKFNLTSSINKSTVRLEYEITFERPTRYDVRMYSPPPGLETLNSIGCLSPVFLSLAMRVK